MHIGQHIKEVMQRQGITATRLAESISCSRTHIHKIFRKDNIDIALLRRISDALQHDFFHDLSEDYRSSVSNLDTVSRLDTIKPKRS